MGEVDLKGAKRQPKKDRSCFGSPALAAAAPVEDAAVDAVLVLAALSQAALAQVAPVQGAPAQGAPAHGAPAQGAPAQGAPAQGAPAQGAPAGASCLPFLGVGSPFPLLLAATVAAAAPVGPDAQLGTLGRDSK